METDDRDRRDWPEADAEASSRPPEQADLTATSSEPQRVIDEPAPAEIESWPSQDARATEPSAATGPTGADAGGPVWPAEEPAAAVDPATPAPDAPASSSADAPTEPIARPASDETPTGAQPPPSEVEAYPAAAADADTTAAAAASTANAVPATESEVGESTQCPRCGTENRPGLAFCRNCGQRLVAAGVASTVERPGTPDGTTACPRCGTHNRAGVAFCQNCGANLRGTGPGYVPPAVAEERPAVAAETGRRGAVLGPVVLLIGLIGIITGYLLPFAYGSGSLFDRAFGANGYGLAFWSAYPEVNASLADQAYFGLAAAVPLLALLLVGLAVAGFLRAVPDMLQRVGLGIALLWSVGFIVLFALVEVAGNWDGDVVGLLRVLTPAGIIFFLASLIVLIGTLTRYARS